MKAPQGENGETHELGAKRTAMSNLFDAMHRAFFDQLFSLDEEGRAAKEKLLREAGLPEAMIAELCTPGIRPGMAFGGAQSIDVLTIVERVLFGQNAASLLLRVKRPPRDEAGHIEIEVLEIGPPSEEQTQGAGSGQP
jgi:hypothetical protein